MLYYEEWPGMIAMVRKTEQIAADIAGFIDGDWLRLEALLTELWQAGSAQAAIPELLGVFERFPDEDAHGLFWSILHGLESLQGYKEELMMSVRRMPSEMGVLMLGRLLNSDCVDIKGVPICDLLRGAIARPDAGAEAKATASDFLRRHAN
jgi:hypothetical protein